MERSQHTTYPVRHACRLKAHFNSAQRCSQHQVIEATEVSDTKYFPRHFREPSSECQFRLKISLCTGRKFPTPELHEWASLASDGVEPSAVFWRVLGVTESEAKERAAASDSSCPRGGTRPALRRSFSR